MPENPAPIFAPVEPDAPQEQPSVWSRMANVIAAPGEAFDGIAALEKKTTLWLVPLLITIVLSMGLGAVMFSNPAMMQKMRQTAEKQMEEKVKEGKISQADADKYMEMQEGGRFMKVMGLVGAAIGVPLMLAIVAVVMFLVMSFVLGADINFIDVFVVVALAGVVSMLETLVTGSLQYATGDFNAQPNLAFLYSGDNTYLHMTLLRLNPFSFWWIAVMGIGFSKVSNITSRKAMLGVLGVWLLFSGAMIGMSGLSFLQTMSK